MFGFGSADRRSLGAMQAFERIVTGTGRHDLREAELAVKTELAASDSRSAAAFRQRVRDRINQQRQPELLWLFIEEQIGRQMPDADNLPQLPALRSSFASRLRRPIGAAELDAILGAHETWLLSEGRQGRCANLVGGVFKVDRKYLRLAKADLRWADFSGSAVERADFSGANLGWARFDDADLPNADFRNAWLIGASGCNADLWQAKFGGANLWGARLGGAVLIRTDFNPATSTEPAGSYTDLTGLDLRHAKLRDAAMTSAFGASANQFGGADLTNAALPPSLAKFEALSLAAEALKSAQVVFATLITACVYIVLTYMPLVRQLNTQYAFISHHIHAAGVKIPVIGAEVQPRLFAFVAPVIVLALYAFLSTLVRRVWLAFAALPALFPDGTPLDEKGYPSPLSSLIRNRLPLLPNDTTWASLVERIATLATVNAAAPATLVALCIFDVRSSAGAAIFCWHAILSAIALVLLHAMVRALPMIVAGRAPLRVDRLRDAELRELYRLQADDAANAAVGAIAAVP